MKKIVTLITTLFIILAMPMAAFAAEDGVTYTEGPLEYTIENQSITITGCFGRDETVEVPSSIAGVPVNTIASGAFADNEFVIHVILPDTITSIKEGAFNSDTTVTMKMGDSSVNGGNSDETIVIQETGTGVETDADGNLVSGAVVAGADGKADANGNGAEISNGDVAVASKDLDSTAESSTFGTSATPILLIVLGALIVVAVIVIVVLKKRQASRDKE